jgi:broad specificity phosphatase PhoE
MESQVLQSISSATSALPAPLGAGDAANSDQGSSVQRQSRDQTKVGGIGEPIHDSSDWVVYLVRHGRTPLNAQGMLRGHLDVPLDATGLSEAQELGRLFAEVPLVKVVTSPLRRAKATAVQLALRAKATISVDDRLIDRDYGDWSGIAVEELEKEFGSVDNAPGVEPTSEMTVRVLAAFSELEDVLTEGPVAVVAHDAVNRLLLSRLVPAPGSIAQSTGCWNLLVRSSGVWRSPVVGAVPGDGCVPWPVVQP